jgi:hypothetical protein
LPRQAGGRLVAGNSRLPALQVTWLSCTIGFVAAAGGALCLIGVTISRRRPRRTRL